MKVILTEKITKLGNIGDTVDVKTGFARNYLLPNNKAMRWTRENVALFEAKKAELLARHENVRKEAESHVDAVKNAKLHMIRQAGDTGQLYGSVSTRDIARMLKDVAGDYKEKLKTKAPTVEQNVGNLSGGNQQKVLLAKWMFANPDILILDEPTRGIDVDAKYEIYCIIHDLVRAGKSVIMISSELPEVLGMSDRIYVMNEGQIVGELSQEEASQEVIMSCILKSGRGE